jgi:hypothetical protein
MEFAQKEIHKIPANYVSIAAWFTIPIFPAISFWIETLASYQGFNRFFIFILILINILLILIFPVWLSLSE